MVTVDVRIGPTPASSARVWVANARRLIEAIRVHPDQVPFVVPADVLDLIDSYLVEFQDAAGADPFVWAGEADDAVVRLIARYWVTIDRLTDAEVARLGVHWPVGEGSEFYDALTGAVTEALAAVSDDAAFADQLATRLPSRFGSFARPSTVRPGRDSDAVDDERVVALLRRAYELAASPLEGIEEAADELIALVGDDRVVIEHARRVVAERVAADPDHANRQVASLLRRAIERGAWRWTWEDTAPPP